MYRYLNFLYIDTNFLGFLDLYCLEIYIFVQVVDIQKKSNSPVAICQMQLCTKAGPVPLAPAPVPLLVPRLTLPDRDQASELGTGHKPLPHSLFAAAESSKMQYTSTVLFFLNQFNSIHYQFQKIH